MPFTFVIDPNTDFDCTDGVGARYRGDPYDGKADVCYGASGELLAGRTESIDEDGIGPDGVLSVRDEDKDGWPDEDPPDVWLTSPEAAIFAQQEIPAVPPSPGLERRAGLAPAVRRRSKPVSARRRPSPASIPSRSAVTAWGHGRTGSWAQTLPASRVWARRMWSSSR